MRSGRSKRFGLALKSYWRSAPDASVDILKKLLGWLDKPSPRIAAAVVLTSLAAIGLSHAELFPVAAKTALKQYEVWVWLALLLGLSLLVTYGTEAVWKAIGTHRKLKSAARKRVGRLHDLTIEERHALQPFFEKNARTVPGHPDDRVIVSLMGDGILMRVTQFGFRISEDVWQYLREHQDLIATPDNPRPPLTGYEWMGH